MIKALLATVHGAILKLCPLSGFWFLPARPITHLNPWSLPLMILTVAISTVPPKSLSVTEVVMRCGLRIGTDIIPLNYWFAWNWTDFVQPVDRVDVPENVINLLDSVEESVLVEFSEGRISQRICFLDHSVETICSSCELIENSQLDVRVVTETIPENTPTSPKIPIISAQDRLRSFANKLWNKFFVSDGLYDSSDDFPGFLENSVRIPVSVHVLKVRSQTEMQNRSCTLKEVRTYCGDAGKKCEGQRVRRKEWLFRLQQWFLHGWNLEGTGVRR